MRDSPFRGDREPPEALFSKVPSLVTLYSQYRRPLTFEIVFFGISARRMAGSRSKILGMG
jgi:hypothetical protein